MPPNSVYYTTSFLELQYFFQKTVEKFFLLYYNNWDTGQKNTSIRKDNTMKKECLTLYNIQQDLECIAFEKISKLDDSHLSHIIPTIALTVLLGIFTKSLLIILALSSIAVYQIFRYVKEHREYMGKRNATLDILHKGDISISLEQLSHIAIETIYEPSPHRKSSTKEVKYYHFEGGRSWRDYFPYEHYSWSVEYHLSPQGLENISLKGDEFYYISLRGRSDIAYIYPCKFFELGEELKNKQ